ncbi:MAG: phytanoyl-CoA dioxygenase family protein [Isosphaeraceae bacterium]
MIRPTQAQRVEESGWASTPRLVDDATLDELARAVESDNRRGRGGQRNLLDLPIVRALARSAAIRGVAESILGASCGAVRGLFFDKTPGANWRVAWHQDRMIAVRQRGPADGFLAWSEKLGVVHVQPPASVLESMLAIRLHLDDCGPENGPVRVLGGSHRHGLLQADAIEAWKGRIAAIDCIVPRGGLLIFRPLLLHASSPAIRPDHRRVIHLEFAAGPLPGGLDWRWRA